MSKLPFFLAASVAAFALACGGPEDASSSEAAVGTAIAGQEWIRCAFGPSAPDPQVLSCTSTGRERNAPSVNLKVTVANLLTGYAATEGLDGESGETKDVASFPRSTFPVQVLINVELTAESAKEFGFTHGDIQLVTTANSASAATAAKPLVVRQPFALWPIRILNTGTRALAYSAKYTTSLSPYTDFLNKTEAEISRQVDTTPGNVLTVVVAAPKEGSFFLKEAQWAVGSSPKQLKIEGPTDLVVSEAGLRIANRGELPDDVAPIDADAGPLGDAAPDTALPVTCGESGLPGCGPSENECGTGLVFGADRLCHPRLQKTRLNFLSWAK